MTRRFACVFVLLTLTCSLFAQPPEVLWTSSVTDVEGGQLFDSVVPAPDGSIFAWSRTCVGSTDPSRLHKFDSDGTHLWSRAFDVSPLILENGMIISDGSDGLFVCGDGGGGAARAAHLDSEGDTLWTSRDPDGGNSAWMDAITRLSNGGVAIAGMMRNFGQQVEGIGVVVFDGDGNHQLTTIYDWPLSMVEISSIIQLTDGSLVIGGGNTGGSELFLLRMGFDGAVHWFNTFEGWAAPIMRDLAALGDGNFAFCGLLNDEWAGVMEPDGGIIWETNGTISGYDVELMPDDGMAFVYGTTVYRVDESGTELWQQTVSGLPDGTQFRCACVTEAGGIIIGGGCGITDQLLLARLADESLPVITLTLTPQGSTTFPASGGTLHYDALVQLNRDTPATGQGWVMVQLPNGQTMGPVIRRRATFQPGQNDYSDLQLEILALSPPGEYQLIGRIGRFPNFVAASDVITFTKEAGGVADGGR